MANKPKTEGIFKKGIIKAITMNILTKQPKFDLSLSKTALLPKI